MPRIPLTSGAYSAPSLIANAQRCVNLFPETNPQDTNPPVPVTHYPRPGLTPLGAPSNQGRGRAVYGATNGDLFAVVDEQVFYINPDWGFVSLGFLQTALTTPVIMADNGTNVVIVDGSLTGATIALGAPSSYTSTSLTQIGDPNFLGSDRVDFLDYFLVFNQPNTRNFYCTEANSLVFNALFIGVKTAWPDNIVGISCVERFAWIFGPKKSEIWFNSGSVPFPFQIQPGLIVEHGCAAKYSIAKQDVNVYWLSESPEGARMVMKGFQNLALRISTHAIEAELLKYARVDDAIGSTYQLTGHNFYCLHFPTADKTWVYDEATKQWHEESYTDTNGFQHRSKTPFTTYAYNTNVGLDWQTGQLYKLDPTNFTDNNIPIKFARSFPHIISPESQRITVWKFVADMEVGTATGIGSVPVLESPWSLGFSNGFGNTTLVEPPLVSLRMSRTRGASWGNYVMQPMGGQGLYYTRPTWNRLGYFVDAVFELEWSTPMKTALNGAFITVEEHDGDL